MIETTYSNARANLASYMDRASDDREVVVIRRRGRPSVALIDADELRSIMETEHLLASPANAARLREAFEGLDRGEGTVMTLEELRRDAGLDE